MLGMLSWLLGGLEYCNVGNAAVMLQRIEYFDAD